YGLILVTSTRKATKAVPMTAASVSNERRVLKLIPRLLQKWRVRYNPNHRQSTAMRSALWVATTLGTTECTGRRCIDLQGVVESLIGEVTLIEPQCCHWAAH